MKSNYRTLLAMGFMALILTLASTSMAAIIPVENNVQLVQAILDAEAGDIIELAEGTYDLVNGARIQVPVTMRGATGDPADVNLYLLGLNSGIIADDSFQGDGPVIFEGLTFQYYVVYSLPLLRHDGPIELRNCVFVGSRALSLIVENGGLIMENCTFLNNEVINLVTASADISLDGCTIQDNISEFIIRQEYGNLAISNSSMVQNTGVCIWMAPNTAIISNSIFTGNYEGSSCIEESMHGYLELTDCILRENSYAGGSLLLNPMAEAVLTGCEILDNEFIDGHLKPGSTTTFICCDLDISRWTLEGEYIVDNDNCSVGTTLHSFGGLKALYR